MKKWIAMLLLACLIVGVCPISVFGEEIAQAVETQAPAAETAKAEASKTEVSETETPKAGEAKTEAAKKETEDGKTVIVGTIEEPEKATEATEPGSETETTASTEETQAPSEKTEDSTEATEETTEPTEETTEPTDETTEETEETTEPTEETVPEEEEEKNYRVYITTNLSALGGIIRKGDVVVLTAHLEGFEDEQYTIEWQCSPDNSSWRSVSGVAGVSASGETCRVVVSAENAHYYWRVLVTIQ